ncbi:IS110 family transposase [Hoeflea ulvae]|uniref:IS110 family transposase n=1 Tax=Hoeflea ulvae TaxID=2983764 RepID=A0ABT3Y9V0_9HYPH|nr:IS110 family transposase [Hoeflea ulvae]MCY0092663.1 IS110 family transposase [Hoeflea ulvae]MCY0093571.1 IS110 family transposase [Hoeflea ulvae]
MQGKVSFEQDATSAVYVGVDVCKEWLDIHVLPQAESRRFGNDKAGIRQFKRMLTRLRPDRIIMEATGKFHRPAHRSLSGDGFAVAIVDPWRARQFAGCYGYLAKTDRLDARMLALLAAALRPQPSAPPSPDIEALRELVNARSGAQGELTALKNRCKAADVAFLRAELCRLIGVLERHVERLDSEIERRIAAQPDLCRKAEILTSVPGIGRITASALIAGMDELGSCTGKQAAMLAGVAPIADDSGERHGRRSIRAGRRAPRRALYMAALSARRYNPALAAFAKTLQAEGKPPKVILVAIMRKLVVLANCLLAQNRLWTPTPP